MTRRLDDLEGLPDDVAGLLIIGATAIDQDRAAWSVRWQPINLWREPSENLTPEALLHIVKEWVASEELRQALEGDISPEDFGL